ncbi:MAG: 30S ribosomal protein S3 [Chloroflexi bacterium]|nr:30S ribosomal protein S3 [Chloroflexota bacterium]
MGHKVHPVGFRLGVIRDWQSKWYADKHYADFLQEDLRIRKAIRTGYSDAAVSTVEIERQINQVLVTIHTARPGIVIGRGGQRVDEMRRNLEKLIQKKVQVNIKEIQQPELDAYLVARTVAEQLERRIAHRRAMKQVMLRTIQAGAKGMKVSCAGRLGGAEIARRLSMHEGQVPLHTLRADIDYGFIEARTVMGRIGVKVWIFKGEILPERKTEEITEEIPEPAPAVEVTPAGPEGSNVTTETNKIS